ncbi:DUF2752 domain-containing protein [Planctellipticum variicoloris]|uniref:DUF2752 domain-containing protein n=1 Tax=Planctellipticum variicoloris TaxID=3064265 RepID=UPI0030135BFD|nr:DUF2752 domain-containing protein [Planctomycetaceae bacterium SH412]
MASQHSPQCDRTRLTSDMAWLWLSMLVILAALVLEVRADQKVALAVFPDSPLPESCTARSLLGIDCLLCGMTRSQIHLAHGRWQEAFTTHRLGWLAALLIAGQIPYRLLRISGWIAPPGKVLSATIAALILGLLLVNWFDRCLRLWL